MWRRCRSNCRTWKCTRMITSRFVIIQYVLLMLFGPGSCKQLNTGMRCVSKHFETSITYKWRSRVLDDTRRDSALWCHCDDWTDGRYNWTPLSRCLLTLCGSYTHDTEPDVNRLVRLTTVPIFLVDTSKFKERRVVCVYIYRKAPLASRLLEPGRLEL